MARRGEVDWKRERDGGRGGEGKGRGMVESGVWFEWFGREGRA